MTILDRKRAGHSKKKGVSEKHRCVCYILFGVKDFAPLYFKG